MFFTQNVAVDGAETEHVEEIPGNGAPRPGVQGLQLVPSLQHRLDREREGGRDLGGDKAGEMPVDPSSRLDYERGQAGQHKDLGPSSFASPLLCRGLSSSPSRTLTAPGSR